MAITITYSLDDVRTPFGVNINIGGAQNLSNVVALANGGFAVAYGNENGSNDFPQLDIYDSPDDVTPFNSILTDDSPIDQQNDVVVTRLADGNIVTVWKEGATGEHANNTLATIVDPLTGTVVASEVVISSFATNADPEVTALPNGKFAVVTFNPTSAIIALRSATGEPLTGAGITGAGITGATDPAIAALTGGRLAVAYVDGGNVNAQLLEEAPPLLGSVGSEIAVGSGNASAPQIAALKNGGFAIVYDDNSFSGTTGIGLKIFDANGADQTSGGPIRVDTNLAADEFDPEITVLDNLGFILVTWTHTFAADDHDIHGRVFDEAGNAIQVNGLDTFFISQSGADETQSSIAGLLNGQFVITWTDEVGDSSGDRISARVLEMVRTSTGDGSPETIFGDALRDIIHGGGGADILFGGAGRDDNFGNAANDVLQVHDRDLQSGETYDGGTDFDILALLGSGESVFDFRNGTVSALEQLYFSQQFGGGATARFNANQFNTVAFESVFYEPPVSGARIVTIEMGGEIELDLEGLQIQGTTGAGDRFEVNGDDGAENIIGTGINDIIRGNGGVDSLKGAGGDDRLEGGTGADTLQGADDNDILDGGADADEMNGGLGNDIFYVDTAADEIVEATGANSGNDTIIAGTSYVLAAGVEVETLRTFGSATTTVINFTGNEIAQALQGNAAANTLNGKGGADAMTGFAGDDTFFVDNAGDRVFESANGGSDRIIALTSFTLAAGASVELLRTSGSTSTNAANLTGNELANILQGNATGNALDGGGGADLMQGFAGDDTYRVDNALDLIIEPVGQGADTVIATKSYVLAAGVSVETMRTLGSATTTAIHFTGNEIVQSIQGNAAANTLDGTGGADTMIGFAGDDTYVVDNAGDHVVESSGGGSDRVIALTSYTLAAGTSVELLRTSGSTSTYTANLNGNQLANTVQGNAAANFIDGGAGNDTLSGLGGNDNFVFTTALGASNVDTITTTTSRRTPSGSTTRCLPALLPERWPPLRFTSARPRPTRATALSTTARPATCSSTPMAMPRAARSDLPTWRWGWR